MRRPTIKLLAAAAAALALTLLAGCTALEELVEDDDGESGSTGSTEIEGRADGFGGDLPALVQEVEPSVVAVLRDGGEGSGVVYDDEGHVVTNHHVVAGADAVTVQLADGTRLDAEVVASDPLTDLAVLRIERSDLPPARFADTLPEVAESVVAIGNPLGFENTVTAGIISGLHRNVPGGQGRAPLVDLLQTDAPISPGSSGGALVGADGEVLGINVAYLPPQAGAVSIGFAVPAPTVTDVVAELIEEGEVDHAFLGVRPAPLTPQIRQRLGVEVEAGVLVIAVVADSPAREAGLEPGDLITAVDDETLRGVEELTAALRRREPGEEITLTVLRDGEERQVDVELGERPTS